MRSTLIFLKYWLTVFCAVACVFMASVQSLSGCRKKTNL